MFPYFFEEWFTAIKLKLCLNLRDFNIHTDVRLKLCPLSSSSSSPPVNLSPSLVSFANFQIPSLSPIPQPPQHFNFNHPAFWQLPLLSHLLPLGPQRHPPFATTIHQFIVPLAFFFCLLHLTCLHFFSYKFRYLVQSLSACLCLFPWIVALSGPKHDFNSGKMQHSAYSGTWWTWMWPGDNTQPCRWPHIKFTGRHQKSCWTLPCTHTTSLSMISWSPSS